MSANKVRRIRLCADDYGISPGVNAAIRDLIARRRINATSAMVVAPGFSANEADTLRAAASDYGAIGLHVTLTAPFKPLTKNFVPLDDGAFLPLAAVLKRAFLHRLNAELLKKEIARQFDAFAEAFGRTPDFVDGHQHVQLFPQIGEAVLDVAKAKAPQAWVRQCGRALPAHRRFGDVKALFLDTLSFRFRRLAAHRGIRTNRDFAGAYAFHADATYSSLFPDFLDAVSDGGVVMCHPGRADAGLRQLDPLTDLREREYEFFLGEDFPAVLAERGYALA